MKYIYPLLDVNRYNLAGNDLGYSLSLKLSIIFERAKEFDPHRQ